MKHRIIVPFILLVSGLSAFSPGTALAEDGNEPVTAQISLSELAAIADIVAVAQVKDTDYVYARSFPNEGSAFLKILIAYKLNQPAEEIIEVYEKGLHPFECYFENPTVFEEGRRYLVFFQVDPENQERYRGLPQGCALEILVTRENRYALRYPITGIALNDAMDELASEYEFRDSYALVSGESLSPDNRNKLLSRGLIVPYQDQYKYTHGVDLTSARTLITPEALEPRAIR